MTNIELQTFLQQYPDNMDIKLMVDHERQAVVNMTEENILHTSETAFVNDEADESEWDHEDGKIELGEGKQYLLINPIIL